MLSWIGTKDVNQLIARGQYARAIKLLEERVAEDPKSVHLRQLLADVLARDGRKRRAVEVLEELVKEYAEEGFLTKAIAVVKKVQRIDPEQSDADEMLDTLIQLQQKSAPVFSPPPQSAEVPISSAPPPERRIGDPFKTSTLVLSEVWFDEAVDRRRDFNWSPLFRDFNKSELAALVGGLRLLVKQPGSIVFSEGEPGASLFVLANGRARVYRRDATGHNDQIAVLREGEIIGIHSVLGDAVRTATITAITECELLELDKEIYEDIAATFPRIRKLVEELHASRAA